MKCQKFKNAIKGIVGRQSFETNPFLYATLWEYIDVVFRKSKINILIEFTLDSIRRESKFSSSSNNIEVNKVDIEKYRRDLLTSYEEYDNSITSIYDELIKLSIQLDLIQNKKKNIMEQVKRIKELDIDIDELDIEKYKPSDFLEYKELNKSIENIQNEFKLNNNLSKLELESLSIDLEDILRNRKRIIKNVERVKEVAFKEYEKALEMERKEIEEYNREKRNNFSSNTNSYGRIERR